MDDKFKDVEAIFDRMKKKFRNSEISQREFVDGLKQLRFKDEEGRFWMIGTQSGLWYYFDGKDWVQSAPPSLGGRKAICIYCGFENDIVSEVCGGCGGRVGGTEAEGPNPSGTCPECGLEIDPETGTCPACRATGPGTAGLPKEEAGDRSLAGSRRILRVRSIEPLSCLWLLGGIGLLFGIFFGLVTGATAFFPGLADSLPAFLKEMQGKIVGGFVFGGLGGIVGFLGFGLAGFVLALVANLVLSFAGGLKIHADDGGQAPGEKKR
jgi:hypothetical protein